MLLTSHRALERCLLKFNRQHLAGLRYSDLKASPHESEMVQTSHGELLYGVVDYGEEGGAYKSIEDVVKKTRNTRPRAHHFNTTVLPALTYASETWAFRKQEENAVSIIERAIERVMLRVPRFTKVRNGIRSSPLRQRSKIRDAAAFAKESKIRWAGHVMRFNDNRWTKAVSDWVPRDIKRTTGRPPTRWSDFFTKSFKEKYDALCVPRERRNHWTILVRDRDWENYWRPLDQFEDQRESR
ncbi:hypothetical protein RB195_003569 [Necator americanus]|uniref:Uncharacterized protein n=1 Tax=Necator americanus TaxID=51031 RepID=A0ABR1DP57_NECAM